MRAPWGAIRRRKDLSGFQVGLNSLFPLIQVEESGPSASLIGYPSVGPYEVQAVGGGTIRLVNGIVHLIDEDWKGDMQIQATGFSRRFPLIAVLMPPDKDSVSLV